TWTAERCEEISRGFGAFERCERVGIKRDSPPCITARLCEEGNLADCDSFIPSSLANQWLISIYPPACAPHSTSKISRTLGSNSAAPNGFWMYGIPCSKWPWRTITSSE